MDTEQDLEWRPLEGAARKFLEEARGSFPEDGSHPEWQDLLDAMPDHNQAMIDAIEDASPGLSAAVTELMSIESDSAATAWTALVNQIFELAKTMHEGADT